MAHAFRQYACQKLSQNLAQIVRCTRLLSGDEIWQRANENTNSVGNLILHLNGNVNQWIRAGLSGAAFKRNRAAEFAERGPLPTPETVGRLEATVTAALDVIEGLDAACLEARHHIQGYDVTGLTAVFHVVEHFSGHTAQIVHMTKVLKNVDLSQYDAAGRRLDGQNP